MNKITSVIHTVKEQGEGGWGGLQFREAECIEYTTEMKAEGWHLAAMRDRLLPNKWNN